jgi:hypothetical protein
VVVHDISTILDGSLNTLAALPKVGNSEGLKDGYIHLDSDRLKELPTVNNHLFTKS